jgi:predicted metal-dependent hydrolase
MAATETIARDLPAKGTPADVAVRPRNVHFDVARGSKGYWLGGDPVGTAVFNALSLTFPDGEKLFIDAVRHFQSKVQGKLREDVQGFAGQEAIHSREHAALNSLIDRNHYPVAEIEEAIRGRIAQSRERGPMGMLLSTIALEHFTAMMADVLMAAPEVFHGAPEEIAGLWRWHALEETEHKAVAFDVFMEVTKHWSPFLRWRRRVMIMILVTRNFTRNIAHHACQLLEADGYTPEAARKAVRRYLWLKPGLFRLGWRIYFAWYRPGFHPWDHDNRAELASWTQAYDAGLAQDRAA